jgi:hypothetical protein
MATVSVSAPLSQPDISYAPDFDKYKARTQKRLANEKIEKTLPAGYPSRLESDFVWDGQTVAEQYDWVHQLNEAQITEIEQALTYFKCS